MTTSEGSAQAQDEGLSSAERKLLAAAAAGKFLILRPGDIELNNELHDAAAGPLWTDDQTIRAEVLVEILTGIRQPGARRIRYVMLRGARITGSLHLLGATLVCPLWLQDCYIEQPVNLNEATALVIRMPGCHVPFLAADELRTSGDLVLSDKFTATGEILLRGARIGGHLNLSGAKITSLSGERLIVGQGMYCRDEFRASDEVRLLGAHISGQLDLRGAELATPGGRALVADRLTVDGDLICAQGFKAHGQVRLIDAEVKGNLDMTDANLVNPGRLALLADGLTVTGTMFCQVSARGEIHLPHARIGRQLDFNGASLTSPGGIALNLEGASIAGTLFLLPETQPDGAVILGNAHIGAVLDDPATWPVTLDLRGLVYDRIESRNANLAARLGWLTRQAGGYNPQIYDQLAAAYRRAGSEEAARKVAIAKQWRRRRIFNPLNWLWYATVGYGYRPWLSGIWLALLIALGTWIFGSAYPAHMIAIRVHPPTFNPLAYTLDVLLPIVDLGQKSAWQPQGPTLYWSWALTLAGWVLTTAVVAGLAGVLKRD